jgi:hypothetical protein
VCGSQVLCRVDDSHLFVHAPKNVEFVTTGVYAMIFGMRTWRIQNSTDDISHDAEGEYLVFLWTGAETTRSQTHSAFAESVSTRFWKSQTAAYCFASSV